MPRISTKNQVTIPVAALGVTIHSPTEAIGVDAARLRSRHPISLPDGYLLATAKHIGATAVSFNRKVMRAAKSEGIPTGVAGVSRLKTEGEPIAT